MFLQIHTLTSHHATLLNRDDAGLAKRIPFGDATRLRVSSQCLKKHWRDELHRNLDLPGAIRSRFVFAREIFPRLTDEHAVPVELADRLVRALAKSVIKSKEDGKKPPLDENLRLKQPLLIGKPEVDYLVSILVDAASAGADAAEARLAKSIEAYKPNLKAMLAQNGFGNLAEGIEGAMFGRFITSDIMSRSDAPVHVAHAMTVHAHQTESDFFTVVDDLNRDDESGAAHANESELGAGVFYGYINVDIPLMVSNFTGCDPKDWREQSEDDVRAALATLIRAVATVSPGAKKGSTAPYAYSDFVVLEAGAHLPRSLSNAFQQAIPMRGNVTQVAAERMIQYLGKVDGMYGQAADLRVVSSAIDAIDGVACLPLDAAIKQVLDFVFPKVP